jgi:hypothetical protein
MNETLEEAIQNLKAQAQKVGQCLAQARIPEYAHGSQTKGSTQRAQARFVEICKNLNEAEKDLHNQEVIVLSLLKESQ